MRQLASLPACRAPAGILLPRTDRVLSAWSPGSGEPEEDDVRIALEETDGKQLLGGFGQFVACASIVSPEAA